MTKRNRDRLTLMQAVKRTMKAKKCSEAEAKEMLLKALQSGALTAFVVIPDDAYGPKQ